MKRLIYLSLLIVSGAWAAVTPVLVPDTLGTQVTLNAACATGLSCAAGSTALVVMAGQQSAIINFTSSTSAVMTIVADCSNDGGTIYLLTGTPATTGLSYLESGSSSLTSIANPSNGALTIRLAQGCYGATHVRVRVAAFTSGSVAAQLRGTANPAGNIASINGQVISLGQKTAALSIPIIRASDDVPADTVAGPTSITAICSDANINACGAGSFVSVALAGQSAVSASWVNATFTSTLVGDCEVGNGIWQLAKMSDNTCLLSTSLAYAADTTTGKQTIMCPQGSQAARIRANAAVTNSTSVFLRATTGVGVCSRYGDGRGRLFVAPQVDRLLVSQATVTLTASVVETTLLAAIASTFLDLTYIKCSNTVATANTISIRDATAGTVRSTIVCPASIGPCEGEVFSVPFKQTAVNSNWTIQAGTSSSSVICEAQAVQLQ